MAKLTKRAVDALTPRDRPYDVRDSEQRGFLVRVEPGGTKTFYFDYRLRGKRNRYKLGVYGNLSPDGARALAQAVAGDVARGIDPQARRKAERDRAERERHSTLRAFLDGRYEPWARTHLKSAEFQLARLRSDFAEQLDEPMHAFNPFLIEGLRQRWKKAGILPRSINRDIQRLQSVLTRAAEWGVLDAHPLKGLKPMKADKTGRVRFLTTQEEAALRKALAEREEGLRQARIRFNTWRVARGKKPLPEREGDLLDHLRPLVLVALNTGLRRGELLGLTWGSVNFSAKLLTVTAATAKSGHTRRIPLNAEALATLVAWYERRGKPKAEELVFPGREGERMTRIDTAWRGLMKAAGLKNFRLHDCRHHFASRLVQAGVDLYAVKELLGHSELAMTEKYSHLAPDNLRAAVEKVAAAAELAERQA
ncbi:MAG: tyrosine-type recombinase/integrase [Steroidobacteraceae bacterium]|nr:tyrosine-type recombinase/integrase [Steroidobacteraceae bacterium]